MYFLCKKCISGPTNTRKMSPINVLLRKQEINSRLQTSIDQGANEQIPFEDVYENAGADIEIDHTDCNNAEARNDTIINSVIESEDVTNKSDRQYDRLRVDRSVCDTTVNRNDCNATKL